MAAEPSCQAADPDKALTAQKHTQVGAGTHVPSTLSLSRCQTWPWSWHTENWQWNEIQGKMQSEQNFQEHSLGPDTFHSEKTP